MKNLKVFLITLIICSFFSSGISAQEKKVALVTFYCDKKISGTGLGVAGEALITDTNFNLKPALDIAYNKFINEFAKDFPFKIEDKNVITSNPAYQNYSSKMFWDTSKAVNKITMQFITVDGFKLALPGGALVKMEDRDECNLAKIFNTLDGVLFVNMDYEIESRMMGVAAGVTAYITLTLYDKNCEKVFRIRESGKSSSKVAAVAGVPVMKSEKIKPLCEDATDNLFKNLDGKLGKIIKKSAKF